MVSRMGLRILLLAALAFLASAARADFTTTTSPSPLTGLWFNAGEPGWGISIAQHGGTIFAAWYTYDAAGKPLWLVMPDCPIAGNACTSDLYSVTGGRSLTTSWSGANPVRTVVGTATLSFTDNNNGSLRFTLNGVPGTKAITRQVFATTAPAADFSDLWWNENESGWGIALTHQGAIVFATIYTYDAAGAPAWYVASNCAVSAGACTGDLYHVTGGTAPTSAWNPASLVITKVGTLTVTFNQGAMASLAIVLDGASGAKQVTRQPFGGQGLPEVMHADVFAALPAAASGRFGQRGLKVTDGSGGNLNGCHEQASATRQEAEAKFVQMGGRVLVSTPTEWCATAEGGTLCLRQFGNAVVLDARAGPVASVFAYLPGLLDGRTTAIEQDSFSDGTYLHSRAQDAAAAPGNCPVRSEPAPPRDAIDGNWVGYSLDYDPATGAGTTARATMGCSNARCTILGTASATVELSHTGIQWRTTGAASPVAGVTLSSGRDLASAFACAAPLDEALPFRGCTFYSFRRP